MAGKPIGAVAMSAAERQRKRRAKLKTAHDIAGRTPADFVTQRPQNRGLSVEKSRGRPSGRFSPGVSGNPGGRPRELRDVQALAREHTPEAIAALVEALKDERYRVSAAGHLLDRAWGKPAAPLELDGTDRVTGIVLTIVSARDHPSQRAMPDQLTPRIITVTAGDE
jgi:hypothetical protein